MTVCPLIEYLLKSYFKFIKNQNLVNYLQKKRKQKNYFVPYNINLSSSKFIIYLSFRYRVILGFSFTTKCNNLLESKISKDETKERKVTRVVKRLRNRNQKNRFKNIIFYNYYDF